jgi:hypothetical protein
LPIMPRPINPTRILPSAFRQIVAGRVLPRAAPERKERPAHPSRYAGAKARGLVHFADLAGLKLPSPKIQLQQLFVELTAPDRPVSLGREQVEIPEMVVGAVRPK